MPNLRRGIFQRRNRNWFGRGKQETTKKEENEPDALTLSTITEIEDDDEHSTTTESSNDRLPRCISFLSNDDADHHREGLNQLLEIVREKQELSRHVAMSLIYGDTGEGKKLQLLFLPFLTDDGDVGVEPNDEVSADADENGIDDSQSLYSLQGSTFDLEDENDSIPRGLESGKHHETALLILLFALRTVSTLSDPETRSIDCRSQFWQRVNNTLLDNMESNYTEGITTMTLSCLRLLHTLEPIIVRPFLKHLLLPYISYLREYGHRHELPIMQREASRLLSLTISNSFL
ncbi:MAG: hypothetical protein SGBAC_001755 [Bacillariaceae sp.]